MSSNQQTDFEAMRRRLNTTEDLQAKGWYHSILLPDGRVLQGTQSLERLRQRLASYPIPQDLRGKRVLDIGAWDGWFSFEMERRGADVVAVDCVDLETFRYAHRKLNSKVEFRQMDVLELTPERVGRFDFVLCLGVIYHLKHPLLALERVCDLTTEMAILESFVSDDVSKHVGCPWMEFYETDELGGQADNWTGPSIECMKAFCRTAGFARVDLLTHAEQRAAMACYRRWGPLPAALDEPAPVLQRVLSSQNSGINFASSKDEYVSAYFVSEVPALSRAVVFPEVEGFGVQPMHVGPLGNGLWQANFKLPPGVGSGWRRVRVRTAASNWSNELKIAVDLPVHAESLEIRGPCDGLTFVPGIITLENARVTFWVRGLAENADLNNVRVFLGESRLTPDYLEPDTPEHGFRQVNAYLPRTAEPGRAELFVRFAGVESNRCPVEFG